MMCFNPVRRCHECAGRRRTPPTIASARLARLALLTFAALSTPAIGRAQGGLGGGGMGSGRHDMGSPSSRRTLDPHMAVLIRADDPNDPTALILAARTDLKLSDSETTALYRVRMEMQTNQSAARAALDTLGPNPPLSSMDLTHLTPAGRDTLIAHRKAVAAANGQLHDAAIRARGQALAVLLPDQQRQLIDLEQHVRQERETPHDSGDAEQAPSRGRRR
jgi:hypothetical protein